jgi:hypothetical protein
MALTRLSELEESTDQRIALRTEAIAEHGYALSAYKDDEPDSRAVTLSNRGTALLRLAESTSQPDDFARAVADFRAALKIDTKDRRPLRWGGNSVNLAVALTGLANHLPGHDRAVLLAEAATLLLRSQEIVTREKQPLFWAIVQTNLGRIRAKQADHSKRARFRSEAATAFRAALEILSERENPREWEIARDELNAVLRDGKGQWSDPRRKRK